MNAYLERRQFQAELKQFYKDKVVFVTTYRSVKKYLQILRQKLQLFRKIEVIIDTETTGVDPWSGKTALHTETTYQYTEGAVPFSIQLGFEHQGKLFCLWIDLRKYDRQLRRLLSIILNNHRVLLIGHNIKFDLTMLQKVGFKTRLNIWDTLTATRLTHDRAQKHSLKFLGNFFSGNTEDGEYDKWEDSIKQWLKRAKSAATRAGHEKGFMNYSSLPDELIIPYAIKDIWYTWLVYQMIKDEIENSYKELFDIEIAIIKIVMQMERRGVRVNKGLCNSASTAIATAKTALLDSIKVKTEKLGFPNFKPGSNKQKKEILELLGVQEEELVWKKKISRGKPVLERLVKNHEGDERFSFINDMNQLNTCVKLDKTYFKPLRSKADHYGTVHFNIKASDTKTGRSSCVDPNLQNIPRPTSALISGVPAVRSVFQPRDGYSDFYFDYKQIEMLMFAILCQEKAMLEGLLRGEDFHSATADAMLGFEADKKSAEHKLKRQKAKNLNFGIVFGMGITTLAEQLGCTYNEAKKLFEAYYKKFPGIKNLVMKSKARLVKLGYAEDMFNRRYHLPLEKSYVLVNSLVQGSAAMVLKYAMIQTDRMLKLPDINGNVAYRNSANPLLVIHDEQRVEIKKGYEELLVPRIKLAMEEVLAVTQYGIKPTVEIEWSDTNWEEKEKFELTKPQRKEAKVYLRENYDKIVLPAPKKVTWFLKAA